MTSSFKSIRKFGIFLVSGSSIAGFSFWLGHENGIQYHKEMKDQKRSFIKNTYWSIHNHGPKNIEEKIRWVKSKLRENPDYVGIDWSCDIGDIVRQMKETETTFYGLNLNVKKEDLNNDLGSKIALDSLYSKNFNSNDLKMDKIWAEIIVCGSIVDPNILKNPKVLNDFIKFIENNPHKLEDRHFTFIKEVLKNLDINYEKKPFDYKLNEKKESVFRALGNALKRSGSNRLIDFTLAICNDKSLDCPEIHSSGFYQLRQLSLQKLPLKNLEEKKHFYPNLQSDFIEEIKRRS